MRFALVLVAAMLSSTQSLAASIGIYSTATCDGSYSSVDGGESVTLYVVANPAEHAGSQALFAAEYRVIGLPAGWLASSTLNPPANVSIGDPFGAGVTVAFGSHQVGCVLLHTLTLQATSSVHDAVLEVAPHQTPHLSPALPATRVRGFTSTTAGPAISGRSASKEEATRSIRPLRRQSPPGRA